MKKTFSIQIIATVLSFLCVANAVAQTEVDARIVKRVTNLIPLSLAPFRAIDRTPPADARALQDIVTADLEFSGVFQLRRGSMPMPVNGDANGMVEVRGALFLHKGSPHFEGRVIDVESGDQIGAKRYQFDADRVRAIAHHFSDEVVRMLTGENGIASSRLLYRRKKGENWEVVMSDYDGANERVLVRQSVPIMYPRWVDDNRAFTYTSFRTGKPDLYMRALSETQSEKIASYEGLNYSVDWSSKRKQMLVTLSKDGNPEIYILSSTGEIKRRLTASRAIDVSPSWGPKGREVLFTSDRTGNPHLYIMEASGSNVRRLTFQGTYNESPCWSPTGEFIAFVSRIDGYFQLCVVRPDGTDLKVLTSGPVNHEDPRWAPNGRHLVFTEEQNGDAVISIIDTGTGGKRILAQGENPDWSRN